MSAHLYHIALVLNMSAHLYPIALVLNMSAHLYPIALALRYNSVHVLYSLASISKKLEYLSKNGKF